jgi:purine-binding chemotaxis protein CheW
MEARTIDWEAVHRRLAAAATAIEEGFHHDQEATRRILEARARAAAKPAAEPDEEERLEVLVFSLGTEIYGVETLYIQEVSQLKNVIPLPCTPAFIAGAMNLRGRILAIVDLRIFFELPIKGLTELNKVIVLKGGDNELGLLADSIDGLRSVPVSDLQDGLSTLTGIRERFLKGITNRMLALLDGGRLLADDDLKVNEEVKA